MQESLGSRRFTILRHANAASPKGMKDRDRPLSPLGEEQVRALMNQWQLPKATMVLSSPAPRCVAVGDAILRWPIQVEELYIPVGEAPGAPEMKEMYGALGGTAPLSAYRAHEHGAWIRKHAEAVMKKISRPFNHEGHLVVVMHGTYGPELALLILGEEHPASEELREQIFDETEGVSIELLPGKSPTVTFIRNKKEG